MKSPRELLIHQQFERVGFGLVQEFQRILPGPSFMLYSIVNKYHGTLHTCHSSDTSMRLSNVSFRELEAAFKKSFIVIRMLEEQAAILTYAVASPTSAHYSPVLQHPITAVHGSSSWAVATAH